MTNGTLHSLSPTRVIGWALSLSFAGAAVAVALLAAIFATEHLPAAPMRSNLQRSYDTGALLDVDWLRGDRIRGFNQYNDCLLVMMVRFRGDPWLSAVAPTVVFNDFPTRLVDVAGRTISECKIARTAVSADYPRQLFEPDRYFGYSRYIHGHRIPFNVLITVAPVSTIRATYRSIAVLLLALILAAHAARFVAAMRAADRSRVVASLGFMGVTLAFFLFFAIDLFTQSLTHGPSDILLFASFGWLSLRPPRSPLAADYTAAVLGALAFAFDFLHGTVPLMLALILACAGLFSYAAGETLSALRVARLATGFAGGMVGAIAAKLAAVATVEGWAGVEDFFGQLGFRMNGGGHTIVEVIVKLGRATNQLAFDHRALALAATLGGIAGALVALGLLLAGRVQPRHCLALGAMLLSVGVIFGWFAVFRNHTAIHAEFMVRLLVWPIGMGTACLLVALASASGFATEAVDRVVPPAS